MPVCVCVCGSLKLMPATKCCSCCFSARPDTTAVVSTCPTPHSTWQLDKCPTTIFADFQAHQYRSNRNSYSNLYRFGTAVAICTHILIDIAQGVSRGCLNVVGAIDSLRTRSQSDVTKRMADIQAHRTGASIFRWQPGSRINANSITFFDANVAEHFQISHIHTCTCFGISDTYAYVSLQFANRRVRQILKMFEQN